MLIRSILIFITLILINPMTYAELKREGQSAYDRPTMYASQKTYEDCDNSFGHLVKQVKIIQGESRNTTNNDPSGGFLVSDTGYQGGRASLVGFGNIAVSVAHGIIDLENGGLRKGLKTTKDGKVYFYTSNPPYDRAEVDLENSEFGCRNSYKDPLLAHILNMPTSTSRERILKNITKQQCDWVVLRLKENLTKGKYQGKGYVPLDWEYNMNRQAFDSEMNKGNIHIVTADPKNYTKLYQEKSCPRAQSTVPKSYSGNYNFHGCDTKIGDSGTGFILEKDGRKSLAGIHTGNIGSKETNTMILFGNEFFSKFERIAQAEKEKRLKQY